LAWGLVAVGLAAPWFLAVELRQPGFLHHFLWRHHVVRFLAPFDHAEPAWFFLPGLLLGLLPWTLLVPGFVKYLVSRSSRAGRRRPASLGFVVLALVCSVAFFSASGCKRPVYLLPAWPPLALALACYLDRRVGRFGWPALWQSRSRLAASIAATAWATGALTAGLAATAGVLPLVLAASLAAAGALLALLSALRPSAPWAASIACTFLVLFLGVQTLQPAYNQRFALRSSLHRHAPLVDAGRLPILCYPQRWDSVTFYLPGAWVMSFARGQEELLAAEVRARPEALLLVKPKSGGKLHDLLSRLPETVEFVPDRSCGSVLVGWVRPRSDPASGLMAQR
jgi:hypothetical protein